MILFIAFLVIALSLLLLYNNFSKNKNSVYICGFLVIMAVNAMLHYFVILYPTAFWFAIFFGHPIPLFYLAGPFLYFYTRNTLKNTVKLKKSDYLHFLPFAISFISIAPYYFSNFDAKLSAAQFLIHNPGHIRNYNISWLYPSFVNGLMRPFFLLWYSIICFRLLYKDYKKNKKQDAVFIKWIVVINSIVFFCTLNYATLTVRFYLNGAKATQSLLNNADFNYITAALFSLIPIVLLFFPEILYGMPRSKKKNKTNILPYQHNHESLIGTATVILNFVMDEKNLLNPDFSIDDIGTALNLKKKEVLYCFHVILNTKFTTLKRELRVDLAKKELSNGGLKSFSMEAVWIKSGFSSKTSFFVAFKQVTGLTPLEYLKSIEKQETPACK